MPWHAGLVHYPIALTLLAPVLAGRLVLVTGHYGGRLVYTHGAGLSSPVPGELGPVR